MRKLLYLASLVVAGTLALAAPASANLITNPGFETGDFTGWTQVSPDTYVTSTNPHSGLYNANLGNIGNNPLGTLSQTIIGLTPGQTLTLEYWLQSDNGTSYFDATWNGVLIPGSDLTSPGAFPYQLFTFDVVATGGADVLLFHERQDPSYWRFDDVSLVAAAAIPEPATLLLFGVGLASFAALRRRRKAKA